MFGYEEELQDKIEKLKEENKKLKEQLAKAVDIIRYFMNETIGRDQEEAIEFLKTLEEK